MLVAYPLYLILLEVSKSVFGKNKHVTFTKIFFQAGILL